jgi:hypothetical protein
LVERRFPKPDVVGSSPTGRVLNIIINQGTFPQQAGDELLKKKAKENFSFSKLEKKS